MAFQMIMDSVSHSHNSCKLADKHDCTVRHMLQFKIYIVFSASINELTGVLTAENKIIYLCYYLFPSITYIKRKTSYH